jgi:hypothetical protein
VSRNPERVRHASAVKGRPKASRGKTLIPAMQAIKVSIRGWSLLRNFIFKRGSMQNRW